MIMRITSINCKDRILIGLRRKRRNNNGKENKVGDSGWKVEKDRTTRRRCDVRGEKRMSSDEIFDFERGEPRFEVLVLDRMKGLVRIEAQIDNEEIVNKIAEKIEDAVVEVKE